MRCSTGKITIDNESLAQEELVRIHVKYGDGADRPNGYYLCDVCGGFHLTSKSRDTSFINSHETQNRIRRERMSGSWENKF